MSNSPTPALHGPLVTVGIPTYNRPAGLNQTLACITGQRYRNLEILVSDNCSTTPETQEVARAWQQSDPRIVYHRQPENIGLEANFKYLLAKARGEYFFWAADDDGWTPDFVAEGMAAIGDAGSVMTGMRYAVRDRGLLRWKPPVRISPDKSCFANAVAFFTNLQPSLFYGIHRTNLLRLFLHERMYDYYDCFFILRQILTHDFRIAPRVCFHVGIDSETPVYKPARPRAGVIYEYRPFLRDALAATFTSSRLTLGQKLRLGLLLLYVGANEFCHFERAKQPRRTKLLTMARRLMRPAAVLLRVPLPPEPAVMVLPDRPADYCSMFISQADLQSEEYLESRIEEASGQLNDKLVVIRNLENDLDWQWHVLAARPVLGRLVRLGRKLAALFFRPLDERAARTRELTAWFAKKNWLYSPSMEQTGTSTSTAIEARQNELGCLLLQLEEKEATIQRLASVLHLRSKRIARLDSFRQRVQPATWIASLASVPQMLRRLAARARAASKQSRRPASPR
jgi:glycosyltransferase involved in cell wall biosynthesis